MNPEKWPIVHIYANRYNPDPNHAFQVCKLALCLYDELTCLHHFGSDERTVLKAGALLHDIGWSFPKKPHHKASRDIILQDTSLPFTNWERTLVSLIARYHRKSFPKESHAIYGELSNCDKKIVQICAGILRIADVLDRDHQSLVTSTHCSVTKGFIRITYTAKMPLYLNPELLLEKCSLLEISTGYKVLLICNSSTQER